LRVATGLADNGGKAKGATVQARDIVERLGMQPHPEGGWYVETYREPSADGVRGACTAIYFLLEQGQRSHWHRVDATEIWLWHAGAPLCLAIVGDDRREEVRLGGDLEAGERPQATVPPGAWQSAEPLGAWALVSCVVAPAFAFSGFELAPAGWAPPR
jgi:predicted cupin superfamily sugar epimerase